mmetsp:Transcript_27147/g.40823  ORF Transcript_27147/g.40823 Transcript_27147/m.40823 type:complete len:629 (+) Transcript_27147:87-1973(+)
MSRSSSDEEEDSIRADKSSKKKHKKKRKKRHRHDDKDDDNDYDSDISDKNKKSMKTEKKRRKKDKHRPDKRKRKQDDSDDNNSESATSSSESSSDRKKKKKKKDKKNKKKDRKRSRNDDGRKKKHKEDEEEEYQQQQQQSDSNSFSSKYSKFMLQLHDLLSNHPDLATELPYLLIKMCSGSSIDISQIPDQSLSSKLFDVFTTLGCTRKGDGEFLFDDNGGWKRPSNGNDDERALVLVKLVKFLLNDADLTMDAVEKYELQLKEDVDKSSHKEGIKEMPAEEKEVVNDANESPSKQDEISALVTMLLDTFQPGQKSQSSLAKELCSIMNMILDGEIICLDGLEDKSLRHSIEKLFAIIGLVEEEMEEEEEDQEKKETSYGYILPDGGDDNIDAEGIKAKLSTCIKATQLYHHKFLQQQTNETATKKRRTLGPSLPSNIPGQTFDNGHNQESDESEDDGPAPFGSKVARARSMKRPAPSINQNLPKVPPGSKREEWMMVPGEHDFLKGVMSSGTIKNRKFKNEKNANQAPPPEEAMNPEIKREVDSIMDAHKAARGPSLVDQHREQIAQEKAAKAMASSNGKAGSNWNWSKKDLDAGRRVDKNYLHMVMGGATKELKNKFQGSYSKGFT